MHLNGIIHQDEYRESIANINRVTQSSTSLMISGLITALCIIGGMVLFIAGGMTAAMSRKSGFPVLVGIGVGLFLAGMIFFVVAFFNIHSKRSVQLHRAIAQESAKYSNRSPIPCSWRLNVTRIFTGGFHRQRHARLIYHVSEQNPPTRRGPVYSRRLSASTYCCSFIVLDKLCHDRMMF